MKEEEYKVHPSGMANCNKCGAEFYVGADEVGKHQCSSNDKDSPPNINIETE